MYTCSDQFKYLSITIPIFFTCLSILELLYLFIYIKIYIFPKTFSEWYRGILLVLSWFSLSLFTINQSDTLLCSVLKLLISYRYASFVNVLCNIVLHAKFRMLRQILFSNSFIRIRNNNGPSIKSCGTPT